MGHVILEASQRLRKVSDLIFFCVQNGAAQVTRQRTTIRLQSSCFGNYLWPYKTRPFSWHDLFPDGLASLTTENPAQMRTGRHLRIRTQFEGVNPPPKGRWERWPSRAAHWPSETHSWLFTGPVSKHKLIPFTEPPGRPVQSPDVIPEEEYIHLYFTVMSNLEPNQER